MRQIHARGLSQATGLGLVLTLVTGCSSSGGLTAWGESITVGEGGTVTTTSTGSASLLANETGGSDALRLETTPVEAPAHGVVELSADGTFRYTHDGTETSTDRFVYAVVDGGTRATATVVITVDPADDPPTVVADAYGNAVGNAFLDVGHGTGSAPAVRWEGSVLLNDSDPDGPLRVVGFDTNSVAGGTVTMRDDGTFTYLPPVGFQGDDTFSYEASDGRDSATGTVTITVTGLVWFLDNARAEAGDGRSGRPFRSVAELGSAAAAGDPIYVSAGATAYDGTFQLETDQVLAGSGAPFRHLGLDLAAGRTPVLSANSGSAVVMAAGARLQGVTIGATESYGVVGTQPGTVTIRDVTIDGAGGALRFTGVTLDVDLLALTSLDSAEHGVVLDDCTGTFRVRGDVTIARPTARAIQIANLNPLSLDLDVDGSTEIVGPASDGLWISRVSGDVRFGDVAILGRASFGIRVGDAAATVTFGDVDLPNPNGATGDAIQFAACTGSISATSLDISGVRSLATPGSASAVFCDSCQTPFRLAVTGGGTQQDGGTIADVQGNGVTVTGEGEIVLARMTFDGFHQSAIGVGTNPTVLVADLCSFSGWGGEADVPAVAFAGGNLDAVCSLTRCTFDGDGVAGNAAVILVESGASNPLEATVGGVAMTGVPDLGCTFTRCATTSVEARSLGGLLTLTVGSSTWTEVGGTPIGVRLNGRPDRPLHARVVECDFQGPLSLGVYVEAGTGTGGGELRATIAGNTGTGLERLVGIDVAASGVANVLVASNAITGLTRGPVVADVAATGDLDLDCTANTCSSATGVTPSTAAYDFALAGAARVGLRGDSLTGFAAATYPTVRLVGAATGSVPVSLYATENGLTNPDGAALTAAQQGTGTLTIRLTGHTAGTFQVSQLAGALDVENLGGFATDNPGATLDQAAGTIGTTPPGTTPLPQGPYF